MTITGAEDKSLLLLSFTSNETDSEIILSVSVVNKRGRNDVGKHAKAGDGFPLGGRITKHQGRHIGQPGTPHADNPKGEYPYPGTESKTR